MLVIKGPFRDYLTLPISAAHDKNKSPAQLEIIMVVDLVVQFSGSPQHSSIWKMTSLYVRGCVRHRVESERGCNNFSRGTWSAVEGLIRSSGRVLSNALKILFLVWFLLDLRKT